MPVRVFDFDRALVRLPGRSVVDGLSAMSGPRPEYEALKQEHAAYVAALRDAGLVVTELSALEEFPDSVFVEDPALVFAEAAIVLNPGAPSRQGEARELAPTLAALFPQVLHLERGHADGGDVLVTPDRIHIGLSARTDATGAAGLQRLLAGIGRDSEVVPVPRGTLHLKTDCSLVDEETLLVTREIATSGLFAHLRLIEVPEDERPACNAIRVNDVLLMREGCPRTRERLVTHGLDVRALPTTQIARIDAGLSCMSLRWRSRAG